MWSRRREHPRQLHGAPVGGQQALTRAASGKAPQIGGVFLLAFFNRHATCHHPRWGCGAYDGGAQMQRRKFLRTAGVGGAAVAAAARSPRRRSRSPCRRSNGAWRRAFPSRSTRSSVRARTSPSASPRLTDNKFQIRVFAGRRNRARPAGRRCRAERDGRVRPHRVLLLRRQGSDLRLRHGGAVRAEHAPAQRLGLLRRRARADARVLQGIQHDLLPDEQHRRSDGRLVAQGDQDAGGHEGREDAHRRLRRPGA